MGQPACGGLPLSPLAPKRKLDYSVYSIEYPTDTERVIFNSPGLIGVLAEKPSAEAVNRIGEGI